LVGSIRAKASASMANPELVVALSPRVTACSNCGKE
jgi:hypothetical protein